MLHLNTEFDAKSVLKKEMKMFKFSKVFQGLLDFNFISLFFFFFSYCLQVDHEDVANSS